MFNIQYAWPYTPLHGLITVQQKVYSKEMHLQSLDLLYKQYRTCNCNINFIYFWPIFYILIQPLAGTCNKDVTEW